MGHCSHTFPAVPTPGTLLGEGLGQGPGRGRNGDPHNHCTGSPGSGVIMRSPEHRCPPRGLVGSFPNGQDFRLVSHSSICLSIYLSICLSTYPSTHPSIYPSSINPSIQKASLGPPGGLACVGLSATHVPGKAGLAQSRPKSDLERACFTMEGGAFGHWVPCSLPSLPCARSIC